MLLDRSYVSVFCSFWLPLSSASSSRTAFIMRRRLQAAAALQQQQRKTAAVAVRLTVLRTAAAAAAADIACCAVPHRSAPIYCILMTEQASQWQATQRSARRGQTWLTACPLSSNPSCCVRSSVGDVSAARSSGLGQLATTGAAVASLVRQTQRTEFASARRVTLVTITTGR